MTMTNDDEPKTQPPLSHSVYCDCLHAMLCKKCGIPLPDRNSTQELMAALPTDERPSNTMIQGPLVMSDIPESAKQQQNPVILGIDEAGRGSVLGPMVYGMAYWSVDSSSKIPKGFNDSKQLTEEARDKLWSQLLESTEIGFGMRALLPAEISRHMLRAQPYNLNEMSHDTAMLLIRKLLDGNVLIQTCYIDTVGNPQYYKRKLEREFPGIEFVVESKADANYAPCSAASVVAKVTRDRMLAGWTFRVPNVKEEFGSGYPSDPKCKQWMDNLQDPLFGYCDFVRYSWAPTKQRLEENAVAVVFKADLDDDDDEDLKQAKGMTTFLSQKRKRAPFFEKRKIQAVNAMN